MEGSHPLSRRNFLQVGAFATGIASLKFSPPFMQEGQGNSERRLECPPSLSDLAADPQTYCFRDLFNPPTAMNELGYAQVGKSVCAITAISFPPYACCGPPDLDWSPGYLLTCEVFVNGDCLAIAAPPDGNIEYWWFPHSVVRSQTVSDVQFSTRMLLPSGRRAVMQSVRVRNVGRSQRCFTLAFDMRAAVAKKTKAWFVDSPGERDNKIVWDWSRGCLLFEAQRSRAVAVQGFLPAADRLEQQRLLVFDMSLRAGESKTLHFVLSLAEDAVSALELYDQLQSSFEAIEHASETSFQKLIDSAFAPGNSEFSGNLPRLITESETLWKLYHSGFASLLFARRVSPDSAYGPTYLTLSGHVLPTLSFPWDIALTSLALALLDPVPLRNLVEVWLKLGMHDHHSSDYISGQGVGPWYAANDASIVQCAWRYVCVTGDFGWLDRKIESRTVLEHLRERALYWTKLDVKRHGLGDYGTIDNLLEAVSTYTHEVAGMNANNVQSMRIVAEMLERRGDSGQANKMRAEAASLAERINRDLYVPGRGYWRCRQPDGTFYEVRHCYDFIAVLDSMVEDLTASQKSEMASFFWRELHTEKWMRALSQGDADSTWNIRPDHSCLGAYAAWPAMTAKGLYKVEKSDKLVAWLNELAKAGNQGPIGQGHFVEQVFLPVNGAARKAPFDAPYTLDWSCIAGGAFTDLVIDSIFGASLTLNKGIGVNSRISDFDPDARLEDVRYQGSFYTVTKEGAKKQHP